MSVNAAKPLNPLTWLGVPAALCIAASLVLATPLRAFSLQLPEPVFAMAPAFAWAVIRPSILPPFVLVGLGLYQDILWGGPTGFWPVCLLAAYAPVLFARTFLAGQSYLVLWAWYAAASAFGFGIGFYIMILDGGSAPSLIAVGLQFLVTAALFPLAHRLIERYEDADVRFR